MTAEKPKAKELLLVKKQLLLFKKQKVAKALFAARKEEYRHGWNDAIEWVLSLGKAECVRRFE